MCGNIPIEYLNNEDFPLILNDDYQLKRNQGIRIDCQLMISVICCNEISEFGNPSALCNHNRLQRMR
jgi:hypothetical protein